MLKFRNVDKITLNQLPNEPLVHNLDGTTNGAAKVDNPTILLGIGILLLGVVSGYLLAMPGKSPLSSSTQSTQTGNAKSVVGSTDVKTFRDSAEGTIEAGGINGEGTHKLIRQGGESQTVYLTSSVLDLGQFEGKKVRVWGETNAAQQAGWLMDVGKVEIL